MTPQEKAKRILRAQKALLGKDWGEIADLINQKYGTSYTNETISTKVGRGLFSLEFALQFLDSCDVKKIDIDISDLD